MSHVLRKSTLHTCKTEGTDQLRSNCEVDQCLCFSYTDSTIPLLSKSKRSSLCPSYVFVHSVSDLFGNHIVGFLMTQIKYCLLDQIFLVLLLNEGSKYSFTNHNNYAKINEQPHEKTNNLHMRKQRCRSASR